MLISKTDYNFLIFLSYFFLKKKTSTNLSCSNYLLHFWLLTVTKNKKKMLLAVGI